MRKILVFCLLCMVNYSFAGQPITINFWHSMAGNVGLTINTIVKQFNAAQTKYHINAVYRGTYAETLVSTVAAFRAGKQPHIVQIFEVGTATMLQATGVIKPISALFNTKQYDFIATIAAYYSDQRGLLALPLASSSAVMYFNKDAFIKAGLNPNKPPLTWPDVKSASLKLLKAGFKCGFTSTWPSWIQLEQFSAWHNIPFATNANGFAGKQTQLLINNPAVVRHIQTLAEWQQQRIFKYGGREDTAMTLFVSGQCPMLLQSSGSRGNLDAITKFAMGISFLPYWPDIKTAPQNTIIGGSALWVMSGFSEQEDQAIAAFLQFLLKPEIQRQWSSATGYLPMTVNITPKSLVINELTRNKATQYSRGLRLGNYAQIRKINAEALESVWSGQQTAQQALNNAVAKANKLLYRYHKNSF